MREVISLFVGQAGVQLGDACWDVFRADRGIDRTGWMHTSFLSEMDSDEDYLNNIRSIFKLEKEGKCIPRCLFIDSDPTPINVLREGPNRHLYHPDTFLSGKEDTGGLYSRGRYSDSSRELLAKTMDAIRKQVDDCPNLGGFTIYNSIGGGTGSGFASLLMEGLAKDYPKRFKNGVNIFPSTQLSTCIVEPYNSVFSIDSILEHLDASLVFDNNAVYDICRYTLGIPSPRFSDINSVLSVLVGNLQTGYNCVPQLFGAD